MQHCQARLFYRIADRQDRDRHSIAAAPAAFLSLTVLRLSRDGSFHREVFSDLLSSSAFRSAKVSVLTAIIYCAHFLLFVRLTAHSAKRVRFRLAGLPLRHFAS